jgi:alkyl hydroperoxide reductase subunit AhpC
MVLDRIVSKAKPPSSASFSSFPCLRHLQVCPTEITAFSDRIDEFKAIDTKVAACSCDSVFSHLAWTEMSRSKGGLGKMRIPLIGDVTKKIARDYGVLIEGDNDDDAGVPLRGTFITDKNGLLRVAMVNDLPIGRSVDEVLRLIKALQHNEQHGEVCPAGWTPGAATMKADPKGSMAYFSKLK